MTATLTPTTATPAPPAAATARAATPIAIRSLCKAFGSTVAVDDVSLDIGAGDLFFLLGPSGCGKTTLLRMLAGFTDPDAGTIRFGDRDVTHLPANRRNAGMVFQGYALWPHMSVSQNVAFGLDVRGQTRDEKRRRVDEALAAVQLGGLADRKPNQLSGGQQQRVALARALVIEPTVLLLDEPLSNLDAKLRGEMRQQIRDICKRAGTTGVYVTHDQKEALSMADAIAVLRAGKVVQAGPPRDLYERPASRFVADFLGETNFVAGEVKGRRGDLIAVDTTAGTLLSAVYPDDLPQTGNVTLSLRPEAIRLHATTTPATAAPGAESPNRFAARRTGSVYLGEVAQHTLLLDAPDADAARSQPLTLRAFELNPRLGGEGERGLTASIDPTDVVILRD